MDISGGWDLVVIGTGPAGEAAAMRAVKSDLQVAVVEDQQRVGGSCTHLGTIPSKALRHLIRQVIRHHRNPLLQDMRAPVENRWERMVARAREAIDAQVSVRTGYYLRNRIPVFSGHGHLDGSGRVRVDDESGRQWLLETRNVILATGSRPYRPNDVDFTHPCIYDSDTILGMNSTPRHLIIYGAGVIGCEYASMFAGLGVRVDLIDNRSHLLDFLDAEISDALSYHLREQGATIRHDEHYAKVETDDHGVTLHLQSGKSIRADALLWSNGRTGNSDRLGLESVGLEADGRGHLRVDERYQTDCQG
ncbi:MAG: FAD-dependent oxidoreductase, partial [Pseudomonadales bacterium]|nr:FAD-dependent oxidoreductase [Pseudomonadales bacterium]